MYVLIPIIHKEIDKNEKYNLIKCALFLEKNGSTCMTLNNSKDPIGSAKEFLKANELVAIGEPFLLDNVVYATIDPIKTDLSSFYTWSEVLPSSQPTKEVWRHFVWNMNIPDTWGTNAYLDSINLGELNVGQILTGYFKTKCV
jgi:hypothetical protein